MIYVPFNNIILFCLIMLQTGLCLEFCMRVGLDYLEALQFLSRGSCYVFVVHVAPYFDICPAKANSTTKK